MATRNRPKPKPSEINQRRIRACGSAMKRKGIAAFLVTHPPDYFHLTGFTGEDSAVLVLPQAIHVISDGRFEENVKMECPWATPWFRKGILSDEIIRVCKELKLRSVALQFDRVTAAALETYRKKARGTRFRAVPPILPPMRAIKDADELAIMKNAIRVAEESFLAMRKSLRIGQTELEVAARLEYEMKTRGASGPAFGTISAEGANAALPHAHAGQRKIKKGSLLLVDWGARVGGYCSDLTRVLFIGTIPAKMREIYAVVLDAQQQAISEIRPGRRMCDIDAVARGVIKKAGYGDHFGHGLGHGLGLEVHEPPSLSWRSKEPLMEGMVVTVEPGIYLAGIGGVRIEDDVIVTPKGCKVLSTLDRSLEGAVV